MVQKFFCNLTWQWTKFLPDSFLSLSFLAQSGFSPVFVVSENICRIFEKKKIHFCTKIERISNRALLQKITLKFRNIPWKMEECVVRRFLRFFLSKIGEVLNCPPSRQWRHELRPSTHKWWWTAEPGSCRSIIMTTLYKRDRFRL